MKRIFKHHGFVEVLGLNAGVVDREACLRIPPFPTKGNLVIEGLCTQPEMPGAEREPLWPDLVIQLDGHTIGTLRSDETGPFSLAYDLGSAAGKSGAKLGFLLDYDKTSKIAALLRQADGEFRRRKRFMLKTQVQNMQLHRITLDGRVLVDFTQGASTFFPGFASGEFGMGMNILGFFQHEFGIGEIARCCASSAKAAGIPVALNMCKVGTHSAASGAQWADSYRTENPYPVNLLCLDPRQLRFVAASHGREYMAGRYNIGYWAWELPEFPDGSLPSFEHVDEVWTISEFVRQSLLPKSPVPVLNMPLAVEFDVPQNIGRAHFGLPEEDFLFLVMYDLDSFQVRKNPQAAIKAFQAAFPDPKGVKLVVKIHNAEKNPKDFLALQASLENSSGIILINRTLARDELRALQNLCDSFVSLHRSEGFGLGLAECMYLGKPVIATNWSGNLEFMDAESACMVDCKMVELTETFGPYKRGQHWAEPDPGHAALWMKKIVNDSAFRSRIALNGKARILKDLSCAHIGGLFEKRLRTLSFWL